MNRSHFIVAVLCVATLGIGQWWLANAQNQKPPPVAAYPAGPVGTASAFFDCTRCPWQYKALANPGFPSSEVLPPGTIGFLHGLWITGDDITLSDGPMDTGNRIGTFTSPVALSNGGGEVFSGFIELNVRFENGLTVSGYGKITLLYRLE